jgi:hypothetical protein
MGGQLASRAPSHAIDYQKDPRPIIDVDPVFVVASQQAGIAGSTGSPGSGYAHGDYSRFAQWAQTNPQVNRKKIATNGM